MHQSLNNFCCPLTNNPYFLVNRVYTYIVITLLQCIVIFLSESQPTVMMGHALCRLQRLCRVQFSSGSYEKIQKLHPNCWCMGI